MIFKITNTTVLRSIFFGSMATLLFSCAEKEKKVYANASEIPAIREMTAELTSPPHVPTPVGKRKAKKLIVDMEILEQE